jgi:hypothetical protein
VRLRVAREVVLDLDRLQDPRVADDLRELLALVRAMQAGGDQHRDGLRRHAGGEQALDERAQKRWFGTGRVMSQTRMHALRRPRASSA